MKTIIWLVIIVLLFIGFWAFIYKPLPLENKLPESWPDQQIIPPEIIINSQGKG